MEQEKMKNPELKPCPFCGKEALIQLDSDHHGDFFNLGCSDINCMAKWMFYTRDIEDLDKSIEKWNTRIPEQRIREIFPKILEALENGSFCIPGASVEFLEDIPLEVKLLVKRLRYDLKESNYRIQSLEK
jgi:hypothetical protein